MTAQFDWKKVAQPASAAGFVKAGGAGRDPRATVVTGINKQLELIGSDKKALRWWKADADGKRVQLSIRYGTRFIPLMGTENTVVVPTDKLRDVLESIKASVQAGDFDEALKEVGKTVGRRKDGQAKAKPVRKLKE